jgi:colanic acid/amylovoran biosynthesis glycosyltransferase
LLATPLGLKLFGKLQMQRIAYLLHRFPEITDTFIKREIRSLQRAGTNVEVIAVWKPSASETTPEIMKQWAADTHFVLPRSWLSIIGILLATVARSPIRSCRSFRLSLSTARPGLRGLAYQFIYFLEAVLAADIIERRAVDHVHNHIGDQSGTVTMLAAHLAGIGYSITFHGWPVFFDAKYYRVREKVLGAKFSRAISYFCRSQLMMLAELDDPSGFEVVHCGLALDRYHYRPPKRAVHRIFCAARLSPQKGHVFLIRAIKSLIEQGYELELRLAGDGPRKQELTNLANELGISDRVVFLGFLTEDEVIRELQVSDLFVLPSFVEGLPVSAMEAMAVGVPVISTNIAGTSELIEDGRTGLLVRPSDSDAIADAVIRMINDYDFRLRAAELGRKKVVAEFELDAECAKLNRVLLNSCDH